MTTITVPGTLVGLDEIDRSTTSFTPRDYSLISIIGGGAPDTLSDGDDATRVRLNAESTTGYNYAGVRISFPPVDIPVSATYPGDPTWEGVAFKFTLRGRSTGSGTYNAHASQIMLGYDGYWDPFGSTGDPSGFELAFQISPNISITASWQEWETTNDGVMDWASNRPILEEGFNNGRYPRAQAFRDGDSWLLMYWAASPYYPDVEISEVSLTLVWDDGSGGPPPLRQFPRDDGLATSTARRFWPPPRSTQRGIRRAGHTYP